MSETLAIALTQQFYEWERRGRGWHKSDDPCELEPPFVPFFGHFVDNVIIDDGRKPSWLSELFSPSRPPAELLPKEEPIRAILSRDDSAFSVYSIVLPRNYRHQAERIEQLLIMLSYLRSPVSFEIIGDDEKISLQLCCRTSDATFMHTQLLAFFPDCGLLEGQRDRVEEALESDLALYTVDFGLQDEFMIPLATGGRSDTDSHTAFFGVLSRLRPGEVVLMQVLFAGTHNAWTESVMRAVCDESRKHSFFLDLPEMPQLAKEKVSHPLFGAAVRLMALAPSLQRAGDLLGHAGTAIVHATSGANTLVPLTEDSYAVEERILDIVERRTHRVGMLLNSRELSTLVHFPSAGLSKKLTGANRLTKLAPAALVGQSYCLGLNEHNGAERLVGINGSQRLRHIHIMGATGTGKSTLLQSLIRQDMVNGEGLCVIDPHGDLIENILKTVPPQRIADVVLIDPSDGEFPVGLNVLQAHSDLEKELLASDLVALFRRFSTSWGDQMNSVFANAVSAFVYNSKPGHIGDLRKFLIDQAFRQEVLFTCTDPEIAYYWRKEYPILKSSSIGSILTRLDSFLRPRLIRNMVCQRQGLNFQELMDGRKIILVKLSQGLLGEENSYLLGAFIVSKLQQTAMARQAQLAEKRVPFYCYVDEFQNFVTPSMASILSGARKYSLGLVLAHQDMQQVSRIDPDIAASVVANAGTRICFRLGDADAKRMREGFSGFSAEDLQGLSTGEAIARVGTREQDFNMKVVSSDDEVVADKNEIISFSRQQYSVNIENTPIVSEPENKGTAPYMPPPSAAQEDTHPEEKELREHRYLQTYLKKLAEEQGYKATIEAPTPDGNGLVDLLIEKEGKRTAIEISVSTTAEWELHNIRKCLNAGYENVIVCASSMSKLEQIKALMNQTFSRDEALKVSLTSPDYAHNLFNKDRPKADAATVIKGYRVKIQYEKGSQINKQDLLKRIIKGKKG